MITYLSPTQAAERLGVSRQRIGQLIDSGRLKAVEVAGRPVISERELARFGAIARKGGRPRSKQ